MQKIIKVLRAVSEKIALPTNQLLPTTPILQDLADAGPTKFCGSNLDLSVSYLLRLWKEKLKKILEATRNCGKLPDIDTVKFPKIVLGRKSVIY